MNGICIIPARGGSKRLPRKNLLSVNGKPLLAYSIEQSLASPVSRTYVSTDDEEIAAVAKKYGAEIVMRPADLSNDTATSESALLHVMDWVSNTQRLEIDYIVFLQCTSPVRGEFDIERAIATLDAKNADSVFSATESKWLLWREGTDGVSSLNYDFKKRPRDQDHQTEYRENGSIYVFRPWVLRECNNRLGGKIAVYEMDYWSSFQVDTRADLDLVEWILARKEPDSRQLSVQPSLVVFDFDGVMTNNQVLVDENGKESVLCDRGDGLGLKMLRSSGVSVIVLSLELNPVVKARCDKLGIFSLQGVEDKWPVLKMYLDEHSIDPARTIYLGNDVNDIECMRSVGLGVAVADAHESAKAAAKLVLSCAGGRGAVRELCDLVLKGMSRHE